LTALTKFSWYVVAAGNITETTSPNDEKVTTLSRSLAHLLVGYKNTCREKKRAVVSPP
jgi:hypothetical protein